ncbi:MAG: hypothetical protein AAFQ59_16390 [Pseudomonadota bacterium]
MEYVKREPMKSASGREPTAFTMKTIKELLAEETSHAPADAETMRTPLPDNKVQQPPHMRGPVPVVKPRTVPAAASAKPALKTSAAPRIDADLTAPPQALPKLAQQQAAPAPAPTSISAPIPEPRKKSLFGRLIGS